MRCGLRYVSIWQTYLHLIVQSVVHDEMVCHPDSMGLHWVTRAIEIISNLFVKEVSNLCRHCISVCGMSSSTTNEQYIYVLYPTLF